MAEMKVLSGSQPLIWVSESRRDIPLGSVFPLRCCDLFSAAFSIYLSDKRVTHSLPVCTAWSATAKLSVDLADLQSSQSRK